MKIAICDDYALYRELVLHIVNEYFNSKHQSVTVTTYDNGNDLINDSQKTGGYDIYILDVLMPGLSGIELGLSLRELGLNGQIIYLTSSEEHAIDAFKTKAFNYILKPIDKDVLVSTLDEVTSLIASQTQKSIIVKTRDGDIRLTLGSIQYAELVKRMVVYHLIDGKMVEGTTIRTTFAEAVQELLLDNRFVLCGASTLVNLHYITMLDKESVQFQNGAILYISARAGKQLRAVWNDFWNKDIK